MNKLMLSIASTLALTCLTSLAFAQEAPMTPDPPPPPTAVAPNGEFVAPMGQATQQTYVPQSVALSGPNKILDWEDGEPIPPGYHKQARTRRGLVVGGAVTLGALYVLSALVAATTIDGCRYSSSCQSASFLFLPVAGPFVEMARSGKGSATSEVVLALHGLGQTAGAVMLYAGVTSPKLVLVRNDLGSAPPKLTIEPYFAGTSTGLRGAF